MREIPPGDDQYPAPPPLSRTDEPPHDRFCDLVMTGGVASGVVYPWAIVELARDYRFRSIGGTSVGAMAAALAAAAEYGRRTSAPMPFEVLRRMPAALGEDAGDGRTRMLSLFQPGPHGRRLIKLWGQIFAGGPDDDVPPMAGNSAQPLVSALTRTLRHTWQVLLAFKWEILLGIVIGGLIGYGLGRQFDDLLHIASRSGLAIAGAAVGGVVGFVLALWRDIRLGIIDNNYGLCKGATLEAPDDEGNDRPALTEWLHTGIQASAGLKRRDRPLTFRDLWSAPMRPGERGLPCTEANSAQDRAIDLQMITTNTTHGRPYRLPLVNDPTRLFFDPEEWAEYFPCEVIEHLVQVSKPYKPEGNHDPATLAEQHRFYQLPGADMPLVVAARLSLSFPLLFAAVPLWAVDYTLPKGHRRLARCLFTDGGTSSNFPIHLFDDAVPRWPTFGLWLDQREPIQYSLDTKTGQVQASSDVPPDQRYVWLPQNIDKGWGDRRDKFDDPRPGAKPGAQTGASSGGALKPTAPPVSGGALRLIGFAGALLSGATDWHDRAAMRMPHVRTRVARLLLLPDEGGLNIGMPREQILRMAYRYGTTAAQQIKDRFLTDDGSPAAAWDEHRWVRLALLINTLREALGNVTEAANWAAYTTPLRQAINDAQASPPLPAMRDRSRKITPDEAQALNSLLTKLEKLAAQLQDTPTFEPGLRPMPELRMRAPL